MKKLFLVAALALATFTANAQHSVGSWAIQPRVGVNASCVTNANADWRAGLVAGVDVEYQATNLIGISAGALYSMQGYRYSDLKLREDMDYINIPIMANFYVFKNFALKVGVQPGFNVADRTYLDGEKIGGNGTDGFNTFDFSIPVGLSYEYAGFVLDARYNWGLTNVYKHEVKDDNPKNSLFQITLGYKFDL